MLDNSAIQGAQKLRTAYERLDEAGYDVINVVPLSRGMSESMYNKARDYLGDVGFSTTRGAVVVGKSRGS